MNAQELQALVVDWHLGELSPEVAALLEAYLDQNPAARAESARIEETLNITRKAVVQHPELVPAPGPLEDAPLRGKSPVVTTAPRDASAPSPRWLSPWLKAAAVLALAAFTCLGGYKIGTERTGIAVQMPGSSTPPVHKSAIVASAGTVSPWAQYRLAPHPQGQGLQVMRVAVPHPEKSQIR